MGWEKPSQVVKIVNWCGLSQDFVAWPEADGYWRGQMPRSLDEKSAEPT